MDEYERALNNFIKVIEPVTSSILTKIIDPNTTNENCRSFQTIINHVVSAGYGYSNYIRKVFNIDQKLIQIRIEKIDESKSELLNMFDYMLDTVKDLMDMPEEEFGSHDIPVRWSQKYDLEQLLEHAIVHILRHRRQLEYFWSLV